MSRTSLWTSVVTGLAVAVLTAGPAGASGAFPCGAGGVTGGASSVECVPSPVPMATEPVDAGHPLLLLSGGIGTVALLALLLVAVRRHSDGRVRRDGSALRRSRR